FLFSICFLFFFQAEDGIRDPLVTGVQTCALPIYLSILRIWRDAVPRGAPETCGKLLVTVLEFIDGGCKLPIFVQALLIILSRERSEERRVGKERSRRCVTDDCKNSTMRRTKSRRL